MPPKEIHDYKICLIDGRPLERVDNPDTWETVTNNGRRRQGLRPYRFIQMWRCRKKGWY